MTIIAGMSKDRVIGKNNKIPWYVSEDFKHFKKTTMGNTIVMGRKTFESVGSKPLPGRPHVIVSRSMPETEGVDVCRSLDEAIAKAESYGNEVFICGGSEIYREALPYTDRMMLSYIEGDYDGDAYFPEFDEEDWIVAKKDVHEKFTVVYYERKT